MNFSYFDGQTHQSLDDNQLIDKLDGYGVIAGGRVTEASEPYHVEVESVNAYFDGDTQSPMATTIDLQEYVDSFNPRKILICVDDTGSYVVKKGEPEQAKPRGKIRFEANRPAYPDLAEVTGVVPLAGVWLGASVGDVVNNDIEDRRRSPDVTLRNITVENLLAKTGITDGGGVNHEGELADRSDVRTDNEIQQAINSDADHGSTADHNYFTDVDARDAVEDITDAADLSGAIGSTGQHLTTDGTNTLWEDMPGPENNQSLDTGDDVTFNSVTQNNATVNNQITWPDGTVTTESPAASAGAVSVFPDLGDVAVGTLANRQSPDGSQGWYFTTDSNGIYYDTGSWSLIAENPGNIDAADLGFDPVTQSEGHVTISPGTHLSGGGQVNVGESITLNVDETSLDTYLNEDYVKEGTELDNLAITHGGDNLDGTYTIGPNGSLDLDNGWQFKDDGGGNAVLNKGSGDGYEWRIIEDSNGNVRTEIDGLKTATESWANGRFLQEGTDEGSGNGLNADQVDGHNVFVQSTEPTNGQDGDIWIKS